MRGQVSHTAAAVQVSHGLCPPNLQSSWSDVHDCCHAGNLSLIEEVNETREANSRERMHYISLHKYLCAKTHQNQLVYVEIIVSGLSATSQ